MADTPVSPSRETFYTKDIKYRRAVSEALLFKVGAAINFINNRIIDRYSFNFGGYFRVQSIAQNTFPSIYIKEASDISYYTMKIDNSGLVGDNQINFKVINELGAELGDLFTVAPKINGAGLVNAMVGYDVKNSIEIRKVITTTYDNGTIDPTYSGGMSTGYELKPYLVSGSTDALNLTINLGIEAQA